MRSLQQKPPTPVKVGEGEMLPVQEREATFDYCHTPRRIRSEIVDVDYEEVKEDGQLGLAIIAAILGLPVILLLAAIIALVFFSVWLAKIIVKESAAGQTYRMKKKTKYTGFPTAEELRNYKPSKKYNIQQNAGTIINNFN